MNQTLQIGPLALPYASILALAALALAWFAGLRLGRRAGIDAEPVLWRMVVVGVVVARLAFVLRWHEAYLADPLSIVDVRDGGWDAPFGFVAAALYGVHAARLRRAVHRPAMAALATAGLVWVAGSVALLVGADDDAPLPALALDALGGEPVHLSGFEGRPVVLNLWASWCPPCRREMPVLAQAQAAHPQVHFVFVNQGEAPATIAGFLQRQGLVLDNVLVDRRLQTGAALGQRGLPATLFYDARGRLVDVRVGELSQATLAQRLRTLEAGRRAAER